MVKKEVYGMHLGEKIKARRMELGMSMRDLAEKLGYQNHSTISRIEAGAVDLPQSKISQFAEVLQTSPAYLMGWISKEENAKNDQLAKLIVRMRKDADFLETVSALAELNEKQYKTIKDLVAAFNE
jgi:transcriptional regulator with XRE-family HTH domain